MICSQVRIPYVVEAKKVRDEFNEADNKVRDLDSEIQCVLILTSVIN